MATQLYMLGLIAQDLDKSLAFYRRLGLALPEESAGQAHVEVKMKGELTCFLNMPGRAEIADAPHVVLEFNLRERAAVDAKYADLTGLGYQSYRAPFEFSADLYFAMVTDPDGNIVVLSASGR